MTAHIRKKENGFRRSLYLCDFSVFAKKTSILCSQLIEIAQKRVYSIVVMTCRHIPAEIIKKRGVSVKKRILSILLAVLMLLSALPLGMVDTAYAAAALASGKCGDSATWTLDNTGTLTISGTGATYNYDMDDDGNSAAPWCTKTRIQRVNKVVVNSGITELGYSMFSNCTQLTSVSLPSGLKRIGSCLFLGCTRLSAITIPSSVTTIESNAFTHCDSITAITLPGGLRTMGDAVCSQMAKLTTATVSGGVTYLSNYAFNDCPSLKTITLPNTVKSIGICAFRYDTALKDVYFNGSVTQWTSIQIAGEGNSALYNADVHCTGLSAPTVTGGNDAQGRPTLKWNAVTGAAKYEVYRARSLNGDYIKYSTVTGTSYTNISYIENGNTYYYKVRALKSDGTAGAWSSIVSVTYRKPAAAAVASGKCGDSAKWKLDAAGTLTISGSGKTWDFIDEDWNANAPWYDVSLRLRIKKVVVEKGITYVGTWAFYDCSEMTSVSLPTTLETMGASVFQDCTSLTSVTIPDGVTFISGDFFRGCTSLKSVTLPDSLRETGGCTFMYCTSLTSVRLPATLLSISWQMFKDCKSLTSLTIPRSVVNVQQDAFSGCTALKNVTYTGTTADWKALTIYSGNEALTRANVRCTGSTVLTAPTLTLSVSKKGQPTLKWNAVSGAAGYQIWCSYDSGDGTGPWYHWLTNLDKRTASFTDDRELEKGRTYTYKVRAVTSSGAVGSFSKEVTFTYNPAASLAAPTVTAGLDDQGYPALTWPAVPDAARYEVYRAASEDGDFAQLAAVTSNSYTNSAVLTDGAAYYYKVRALDSDGEAGPFSDVVSVTYTARPALVASGKCGDSASWKLDADGVLTISGIGAMDNYSYSINAPWYGLAVEEAVIEQGITSIGSSAFRSCAALTSVTIPSSVITIGDDAFYCCENLLSATIPSGVSSIGFHAFIGCDSLICVVIPESVISIGQGVFASCSKLAKVVLLDGISEIPTSAFFNCKKLTEITIPNTIKSIGANAFAACDGLTGIAIPRSVTEIDSMAFEGCHTSVYVDQDNNQYCSINGALYNKEKTILYYAGRITEGKYDIPEGTQSIGDFAFAGSDLLTHVTIPTSTTNIGGYAFSNCANLLSVEIPDGVTNLPHSAFYNCAQLGNITLPKSIKSIGRYVFDRCRSLTDVYYGGTAAEWLAISVADRNDPLLNAALHCTGSALVASGKCGDSASWKLDADGVLTISGIGAMDNYSYSINAPWYGLAVEEAVIEQGITSIGSSAFRSCAALTSVTIPSSVITIGDDAFYCCENLLSATIPSGVSSIGFHAFIGCDSLICVVIPESVISIGQGVFASCSKLAKVVLLDGISEIPTSAFFNCKKLTEITIPNTIKSIGANAFAACDGLTGIAIPRSVTEIDSMAFEGCHTSVYVDQDNNQYCSINGALYNKEKTILYYAGRITEGKYDIPEGTQSIGDFAFAGSDLLTHVTIPTSTTNIGGYAFSNCANLLSVEIPDGVTNLPHSAFYNCAQLGNITLPKSIKSIGRYVFDRCRSLTDVYYGGTAAEWLAISVADRNDPLLNAALHCTGQSASRLDVPAMTLGEDCSDGKPTVWWPAVTGAERYEIWRAQAASDGSAPAASAYTLIVSADVTFHKDTTAEADTWYYYKVRAVSGSTYSDFSQAAHRYCEAPPTMDTPEITSLELDDSGKPVLTWRTVEGAARYQVFRSEDNGFSYSPMGTVLPTGSDTITWTDTTAVSGTGYYYGVGCYDDNGHYSSFGGGEWWVTAR